MVILYACIYITVVSYRFYTCKLMIAVHMIGVCVYREICVLGVYRENQANRDINRCATDGGRYYGISWAFFTAYYVGCMYV